jgi:hypothetical protein
MAQHSFTHLVQYELSSPEFLKRLQCEEALEGENARLSCQVIGEPGIYLNYLTLHRDIFYIHIFLFINQCQ